MIVMIKTPASSARLVGWHYSRIPELERTPVRYHGRKTIILIRRSNKMIGQGIRAAVPVLVVILFTRMAYERNGAWHTLLTLWQDAAATSPENRLFNNLGNYYILAGMHFKGIAAYQRAVVLDNNNIEAYYNLGVNFENVGILNQAVYCHDRFCKTAPPTYREQQEQACKRVDELTRSAK
jgi:tetratricopeptide (TPR) repeat protein